MNINEKDIEIHNDLINDIILYQKYGFSNICEIYINRDWTLIDKEYVSFGARLSIVSGFEEIVEQNRFFITEKKGKRFAEVMNEDGTSYKIELNKAATLYTYVPDITCCLEDSEKQFVKSYDCHFWILEHDGKTYIPKFYNFEDIYRKIHPKDVDLSTLIEEVHLDSINDLDEEMLNKLIASLILNEITDIALKIETECGTKTFNDAVLLLKKEMLSLPFNKIKIAQGLIEDYQKEYVDILSEEIKVEEEEDFFETEDGYIKSRVWFTVKKLKKNNLIIVTMHGVEDPYEKVSLKLISRKKYLNQVEILSNALNSLCFSLVFQNQCWFKDYEV